MYRGRSAQQAQAQVKAAVSSAPAVLAALPTARMGAVASGAASISAPRLAVVKVSGSIPAAPQAVSNSQHIDRNRQNNHVDSTTSLVVLLRVYHCQYSSTWSPTQA
jgi:hypothetical protein